MFYVIGTAMRLLCMLNKLFTIILTIMQYCLFLFISSHLVKASCRSLTFGTLTNYCKIKLFHFTNYLSWKRVVWKNSCYFPQIHPFGKRKGQLRFCEPLSGCASFSSFREDLLPSKCAVISHSLDKQICLHPVKWWHQPQLFYWSHFCQELWLF